MLRGDMDAADSYQNNILNVLSKCKFQSIPDHSFSYSKLSTFSGGNLFYFIFSVGAKGTAYKASMDIIHLTDAQVFGAIFYDFRHFETIHMWSDLISPI